MNVFTLSIFSFLLTKVLIIISLPFLRKYFPDKPNKRSSHNLNTPRSGGIIILIVSILISILQKNYLMLICLPLSLVNICDDRLSIKWKYKLAIQIITILVLFINISPTHLLFNTTKISGLIAVSTIVFLSIAILNFINFMDGIDGLVAGCMFVILITASYLFMPSMLPISFSIFAFLIFNWSPAKLFMGDVGSIFIGFVFIYMIYKSETLDNSVALILIASPLFLDAVICLWRRLITGQNIFKPHNLHLYQRLQQSGLSHSSVSTIYISATASLAMSYLFFSYLGLLMIFSLVLVIGFYLEKRIANKFRRNT